VPFTETLEAVNNLHKEYVVTLKLGVAYVVEPHILTDDLGESLSN